MCRRPERTTPASWVCLWCWFMSKLTGMCPFSLISFFLNMSIWLSVCHGSLFVTICQEKYTKFLEFQAAQQSSPSPTVSVAHQGNPIACSCPCSTSTELDYGATDHVSGMKDLFTNLSPLPWLYLMKDCSKILSIFCAFYAKFQKQLNCCINTLHSDNVRGYFSSKFSSEYFVYHGIQH